MSTFEFVHAPADRPTDFRRSEFLEFYAVLQGTDMFKSMEVTVEGSPWHREANVKVHTDMVVSEFVRMTDEARIQWTRDDYLGAVACAFHDTGKPASKVEKYREDRGHYFAFHGHETVSSRLFETYACEHPGMFTAEEIYKICWMIEYHMPWEMAAKEKRHHLAMTARDIGVDVWTRALLSDQYGRIADDQDAKNARAEAWIAEFRELCSVTEPRDVPDDAPEMFVLIGTSGSGKSTLVKEITGWRPDANVFSLDELRHQFYNNNRDHDGYRDAFEQSVNDKTFNGRADSAFTAMVRTRKPLIIDNVNASAKRRANYITQGHRNGYKVVAVTMPVSLQTVLDRQGSRTDKSVPDEAVRRQYASIQQPSLGEFDEIVVSGHNLTGFFDPNPSGDY